MAKVVDRNPRHDLSDRSYWKSNSFILDSNEVSGYFSVENPYFGDLKTADSQGNKDNVSALYEKAVNWEADRQALLEERSYQESLRDEQRAYDSPSAELDRMRKAGYNPDVVSSSGSGSVSGSGSASILGKTSVQGQTQGTMPFDSPTNDMNKFATGLSAVSNFISSVSGAVSGIMGGVTNMRLAPSQSQLNKSQAGLADAQAKQITDLLDGHKKQLNLSNAQAFTDLVGDLSSKLSLESSDEDISKFLLSAGVSSSDVSDYVSSIREYQKHPTQVANYFDDSTRSRWSRAENALYSDSLVGEMTELKHKVDYETAYFDYYSASLQNRIISLFSTDDNVDRSVSLMESNLQGDLLASDFRVKSLQNDTSAFLSLLSARADLLKDNMARINTLSKLPQSPSRVALIERLESENIALRGLYSNQFSTLKLSYLNGAKMMYENQYRFNPDGSLNTDLSSMEPFIQFNDSVFNDLLFHNKTPQQIAQDWIQTVTGGLRDIGVTLIGGAQAYSEIKKPKIKKIGF